jgi:3-oxoacyl-[acyl-carrier-protein] synthase II
MLQNGIIPKINYAVDTDKECELNLCKKEQKPNTDYALSNSFGFGGHNSSLVFKKWREQ